MSLLSLIVIVVVIEASPCIHNYPNSTIGYLVNNINIDSSIYYLGHKTSTNECEHSCINFNYLCNTSSNNILYNYNDINTWTFNNSECSITALITDRNVGSTALLTQDLISNEYIIELQLSILSLYDAGVIFKATNQLDNYRDYYFSADAANDRTITGFTQNGAWPALNINEEYNIDFNKKYNLSVHVINNTFTTYFNGEQMYTNTDKKQDWIDESLWTQSYAGVYGWNSDVIFHSFNIEFPNNNDNEDKKWCSAYMYDKDSGDCYAYYGDNYTIIESTVSLGTGYDSAVVYPSTPCVPLPSNEPTTSSLDTRIPSQSHTTMTLMSTESMKPSVDRISTAVTVAVPVISETYKITEIEREDEDEGVSISSNMMLVIGCIVIAVVCVLIVVVLSGYMKQKKEALNAERNIEDVEEMGANAMKHIGEKRCGKQQRMVVHEMQIQMEKHVEQSIDSNRDDINTTIGAMKRDKVALGIIITDDGGAVKINKKESKGQGENDEVKPNSVRRKTSLLNEVEGMQKIEENTKNIEATTTRGK